MKPNRNIATLCCVLLIAVLGACTTAPETGRSQLLMVSPEEELRIGITQFRELKAETPIYYDREINRVVKRVGRRIAAVAPLEPAQWEFVVFDNPDKANAFCLPGGKVGVYTGILKYAQDEAGLAAIIGHEVGHAVAHHGAERASYTMLSKIGSQVVGQVAGAYVPGAQQAVSVAYGLGSQYGVLLPYSRIHELEADQLGMLYMARAGYDPRESIAFWERFAAGEKGTGPAFEFLSTHPMDENRIQRLRENLPRAMADYRAAGYHQ